MQDQTYLVASESVFSTFGSQGYDFMIPSTRGGSPNQVKITLFINNDNSWSNIKISYIVSARRDLRVGSFLIDTMSFHSRKQTNFEVRYIPPEWEPESRPMQAFGAISGIRTGTLTISKIYIKNVKVESNSGKLTFYLSIDSGILVEYLYLSYVLWISSPSLRVSALLTSSKSEQKN